MVGRAVLTENSEKTLVLLVAVEAAVEGVDLERPDSVPAVHLVLEVVETLAAVSDGQTFTAVSGGQKRPKSGSDLWLGVG